MMCDYPPHEYIGFSHCWRCARAVKEELERVIADKDAMISTLSDELLRVRTTAHGAAHQLDNIAVEQGWGAGIPPLDIANRIRSALKEGTASKHTEDPYYKEQTIDDRIYTWA